MAAAVLRGNEGDLNREWSWDGLKQINCLAGTVGEEIQVGCRMNSGTPHKRRPTLGLLE